MEPEWRRRITPRKPVAPLQLRRGEITPAAARSAKVVRTGPARYLSADVDRSTPEQRIIEASQALPEGGAVTGWAALHLYGVGYCRGTDATGEPLPVPLAVGVRGGIRSSDGQEVLRGILRPEDRGGSRLGVPVTSACRATVDAARLARSDAEAVVELDKALGAGIVTVQALTAYVEGMRGWKGVPRVRLALTRASDRVRSPQETRLRLFVEDRVGLTGLVVNATVLDLRGRVVGEVDLLDPASGTVFEYDGGGHLEEEQKSWDAVKEDRLRSLGLEVVRVTKGHLGRHVELEQRIDRAVARARATSGPRRWTAQLRPLDGVRGEGLPPEELDAETRAWLAGADLRP